MLGTSIQHFACPPNTSQLMTFYATTLQFDSFLSNPASLTDVVLRVLMNQCANL